MSLLTGPHATSENRSACDKRKSIFPCRHFLHHLPFPFLLIPPLPVEMAALGTGARRWWLGSGRPRHVPFTNPSSSFLYYTADSAAPPSRATPTCGSGTPTLRRIAGVPSSGMTSASGSGRLGVDQLPPPPPQRHPPPLGIAAVGASGHGRWVSRRVRVAMVVVVASTTTMMS